MQNIKQNRPYTDDAKQIKDNPNVLIVNDIDDRYTTLCINSIRSNLKNINSIYILNPLYTFDISYNDTDFIFTLNL